MLNLTISFALNDAGELTVPELLQWYMRFVCPLPLSIIVRYGSIISKAEHTLGFLRRGNGFGVDVEAAGAANEGVGLGVISSNTAGDDGGGEERLMLIQYIV